MRVCLLLVGCLRESCLNEINKCHSVSLLQFRIVPNRERSKGSGYSVFGGEEYLIQRVEKTSIDNLIKIVEILFEKKRFEQQNEIQHGNRIRYQ